MLRKIDSKSLLKLHSLMFVTNSQKLIPKKRSMIHLLALAGKNSYWRSTGMLTNATWEMKHVLLQILSQLKLEMFYLVLS